MNGHRALTSNAPPNIFQTLLNYNLNFNDCYCYRNCICETRNGGGGARAIFFIVVVELSFEKFLPINDGQAVGVTYKTVRELEDVSAPAHNDIFSPLSTRSLSFSILRSVHGSLNYVLPIFAFPAEQKEILILYREIKNVYRMKGVYDNARRRHKKNASLHFFSGG